MSPLLTTLRRIRDAITRPVPGLDHDHSSRLDGYPFTRPSRPRSHPR